MNPLREPCRILRIEDVGKPIFYVEPLRFIAVHPAHSARPRAIVAHYDHRGRPV